MPILASKQLNAGESISLSDVVTGREISISVSGGPVDVLTKNGTDNNFIVEGVLTDESANLVNMAVKTLNLVSTSGTAYVTVATKEG